MARAAPGRAEGATAAAVRDPDDVRAVRKTAARHSDPSRERGTAVVFPADHLRHGARSVLQILRRPPAQTPRRDIWRRLMADRFSVLAGVSTYSFGGMRTFVQSLMEGKIHDAVPQVLARCGYKNSLFYRYQRISSRADGSIRRSAFQTFSTTAPRAKRFRRDRFYYQRVLDNIQRNLMERTARCSRLSSRRPRTCPIPIRSGRRCAWRRGRNRSEMGEYLRRPRWRIWIMTSWSLLAKRFPKERFLIVQYGDHQPIATHAARFVKAQRRRIFS